MILSLEYWFWYRIFIYEGQFQILVTGRSDCSLGLPKNGKTKWPTKATNGFQREGGGMFYNLPPTWRMTKLLVIALVILSIAVQEGFLELKT